MKLKRLKLSSGMPDLVFSLFDESEIKAFYNQAKDFGQTNEDYLPTPQYINKHEQIIKDGVFCSIKTE